MVKDRNLMKSLYGSWRLHKTPQGPTLFQDCGGSIGGDGAIAPPYRLKKKFSIIFIIHNRKK